MQHPKNRWGFPQLLSRFSWMGLSLLTTAVIVTPAYSAERIAFFAPPFGEFSIAVEDLEIFAQEGRITPEFSYYTRRVPPKQLAALRNLLQTRINLSPVAVSQFTYSPLGETLLTRLGQLLKADFQQNGFYALRGAIGQAAADPQGLTVVNVLRQFPLQTLRLDFPQTRRIIGELAKQQAVKDLILQEIHLQASAETTSKEPVNSPTQADLRLPGQLKWQKKALTFSNPNRLAAVSADIYLPQQVTNSVPVIVISHGWLADRHAFTYLGEHLASYGFAVAVLEHPDTTTHPSQLEQVSPPPDSLIHRPSDVTFLLNELQRKSQSDPTWQGKLNLQQVGVIGQSLGGYTALAVGGAQLNLEQLPQKCNQSTATNLSFDLSVVFQCQAAQLLPGDYHLHDPRVKAVLAVNPLSSKVFGQQGLSQIQIPVMLVAAGQDFVTPAVSEQIYPFTWLTPQDKYLVLMKQGTHFSLSWGKRSGSGTFPVPPKLVGPDPNIAHSYLSALSTAFFKTHLANQSQYRSYLSQSYVEAMSVDALSLSLVKSLTASQLEIALVLQTHSPSNSEQITK